MGKTKNKKAASRKPTTTKKTKTPPKATKKEKAPKGQKNVKLVPVTVKHRNDKNGGHNHVIIDTFEDKHVSVGLSTRKKKGKNATNYMCHIDPLGTGKDSYMRRQGTVAEIKSYSPKEKRGNMHPEDYKRAVVYGDRAKEKYLNKKKQ